MDFKKPGGYQSLQQSYPVQIIMEPFEAPVTLPYDEWVRYVAQGQNTLYGGAIVPGGTEENGAVYSGHVRQNPFTAPYY
jgi:hypothetical protein